MGHARRDRRALLTAHLFLDLGYTLSFRRSGWWECLLVREVERWIGSGTSRYQALEHALDQALPSHGARELLARHLLTRKVAARSSVEVLAEDEGRASGPQGEGDGSDLSARLEPPAAPSAPSRAMPTAITPSPPPRVLTPLVQIDVQPAPRRVQRKLSLEEARARFTDIEETMEQMLEEASLLEPERQRLLLLSWIATARSVEADAASGEAFDRTRAIARQLSRLAKIWWPGSVPALGIDALPRDCAGDIPGVQDPDMSTWTAVAAAAEAALEALELDGSLGPDQHGWWDAEALAPAHAQPDALLMEVVAYLERITTRLVRPTDEGEGLPGFCMGVDRSALDVAVLARETKKLRWLRGSVSDLELWGAAMGRMRWLAMVLRPRAEPLAAVLHPRHRPLATWAKDLGHDPEKKRRQKEKKALINTKASPKPEWSSEQIHGWLQRALELGEVLPNERIAQVVAEEGVVEPILAIAASSFSEKRNHRTRLDTIQQILRRGPADGEPVPAVLAPIDEDSDAEGASYFDRLLELVVPRTRGRRALFVSNRNDPTIDALIRQHFLFEDVDHCEIKNSNVSAKAKSIEQDSYDMVLAATGFMSHSAENVLKEAARKAQVPHVRVNRGRPLSVALALARQFGINTAV